MTNIVQEILLENKTHSTTIKLKGAELSSYYNKSSKKDIIWTANTDFWGRHAPVLFPIVGRVWNDKFKVDEKTYELKQHGFARDLNWSVISTSKTKAVLILNQNEFTLSKFPFSFSITAIFELNENSLNICHKVLNTSEVDLPFSIGVHPGFNLPWDASEKLEDYFIEFKKEEQLKKQLLTKNGFRSNSETDFKTNNNNSFKLSDDLFIDDAIVFNKIESDGLFIKSKNTDKFINVNWKNYPHLGIWKPLKAPFICIEPWQGMVDEEEYNDDFYKKHGILTLKPNEQKVFEWELISNL
jgi:galactose mutarotase-like enzyme